jgi:hypothetical protein
MMLAHSYALQLILMGHCLDVSDIESEPIVLLANYFPDRPGIGFPHRLPPLLSHTSSLLAHFDSLLGFF